MKILKGKAAILATTLMAISSISNANDSSMKDGVTHDFAQEQGPVTSGAMEVQALEVNSDMARWKKPQSLEFVTEATERFNFPNWQSGNDDSIYYNMNIPSFFKTSLVPNSGEFSVLERDINPKIQDVKFKAHDGSTTPSLKEYLTGPRQVQAMMMMHKGKVVFETYPGMNPNDMHVWMSASKTSAGLLVSMLADEGKINLDNPVSDYVPELKDSAWDNISVKNTMNMSVAVDNEETFESLMNPKSWISSFFTSIFTGGDENKGLWRKLLKEVTPLKDEKPGDRFRYSTSNTMVLVLIAENITKMPWQEYFNAQVWSKIGARNPFIVGLTPDGTAVGGGLNFTTPEDMLRFAMLYTPSWNKVSSEQVISDKLLSQIQTMGDRDAYKVSTELGYGQRWFGETPAFNTAQWDHAFDDGAMFKHGNMGQGIYVDPKRDFAAIYFGLATNDEEAAGVDHSPGYLRNAAKMLAGF